MSQPSVPPLPEASALTFAQHDVPDSSRLEQIVVELKRLQKGRVEARTQGYCDRVQRACSWLAKSLRDTHDPESGFIFTWIALNALCGVRPEVLSTKWWGKERASRPASTKYQGDDPVPSELEWYLWRVSGFDRDGRVIRGVFEERWDDVLTVLWVDT